MLFFLILGLVVGSFINCVVYRLNYNLNPLKGRSICPKCKKQIVWYDNIPLLSFTLLRGRCRRCHSPISWQYPLVELATGVLTVFIYQWAKVNFANPLFTIYYLLITYFLIAIFVSDLLYLTIPDEISYPAIAIASLWLILTSNFPSFFSGIGAGLLFLLLHWLTKGKGMAIGDVKLTFLLGLFLGWPKIAIGLYLAFLTGAIMGVILILTKRGKFGQPIAFGPSLVSCALIALFWGEKLIGFYLFLMGR